MNDTITDSRLEEMMLGDAGCESNHGGDNNECSTEPTHRFMPQCWTAMHKNVCAKAAVWILSRVAEAGRCGTCDAPVEGCWLLMPV